MVPLTNMWRYQQGVNLDGTTWQASGFDDSNWPSGSALLYVEDNSAVSPRNTSLTIGRTTYYFRTHFSLPYQPRNILLNFSARIDDGAVFHLNGMEIQRVRMLSAPVTISYTSLAAGTPSGGDATSMDTFVLSGQTLSNLVVGDNVLAVEVHQNDTNSDDIVFGASMTVRFTNSPPIVVRSPTNVAVMDGRPVTLSASIDGDPSPALQWFKDGSPVSFATNASMYLSAAYPTNAGVYHLRASNINGVVVTTNAIVTVLGDTDPPVVVAAVAHKFLTNVTVSFSEPLLVSAATNPLNYEIHQTLAPSNHLAAFSVSVSQNSNVVLTTVARIPGLHYSILVTGVRDRASTTNEIQPMASWPLAYQVDLVALDEQTRWRYSQTGGSPGTNWWAPGFDDSSWPFGAAIFHAGLPLPSTTDPVRTTLSLVSGTNRITAYYFRTPFVSPGLVNTNSLRLHAIIDDGGIFYLNSKEVFSIGMPGVRPVDYSMNANRSIATPSYEPSSLASSGWLIPGTNFCAASNYLAAEVHQYSSGYSDVAFAASLDAVISEYFPQLQWTIPDVVVEGSGVLRRSAEISILEPLPRDLNIAS